MKDVKKIGSEGHYLHDQNKFGYHVLESVVKMQAVCTDLAVCAFVPPKIKLRAPERAGFGIGDHSELGTSAPSSSRVRSAVG